MEMIFLTAVLLAACFGLILVGVAIRGLLRREEGEIGGLQLRGAGRRMGAVARACIAETVNVRLAAALLLLMVAAIASLAAITIEERSLAARVARYVGLPLIPLLAPFAVLGRLSWLGVRSRVRAGRTIALTSGLVALPLLMALFGVGDGTIKGRVQMFLNYQPGITVFALDVLTIVLATRSLSAELAGKQIFTLASKPIPRWQIVVGKWLGVTVLNAMILGIALAGTYVGVRYIMWTFHHQMHTELVERGGLSDAQATACIDAINDLRGPGAIGVDSPIVPAMSEALGWDDGKTEDRSKRYRRVLDLLQKLPEATRDNLRRLDEVRRQVLVSRAALRPDPPDVAKLVEEHFNRLKNANELPDLMTPNRVRQELTNIYIAAARTVPPHTGRLWRLQGPPPLAGREFLLSVRYKLEGFTPALQLPGLPPLPEETFLPYWFVGDLDSPNAFSWPDPPEPHHNNAWTEFEVPSSAVKPDGRIELRFLNQDPRQADAIFAVDGLEVLYSAGTFAGNLVRGWFTLMLPLMLLAAMGVFFATFCTFPVALPVTLILYLTGISGGFLAESIGITKDVFPEYPSRFDEFRQIVGQTAISALTISTLDVERHFVEGRLLDWSSVLREAGWTVLLRGSIFLLLAVYIFRRRELAAIIV